LTSKAHQKSTFNVTSTSPLLTPKLHHKPLQILSHQFWINRILVRSRPTTTSWNLPHKLQTSSGYTPPG